MARTDVRRKLPSALSTPVAFAILAASACDTMHKTTMLVRIPAAGTSKAGAGEATLASVRDVLKSQGFTVSSGSSYPADEEWSKRDPAKPPGVRVSIVSSATEIRLRISQDLYGPRARTPSYEALEAALKIRLEALVGRANLQVE